MTRRVVVNDLMQQGYVYYRTAPAGRNVAPAFRPQLTPRQMLRLGVFGGRYMTDCRGELPPVGLPALSCAPSATIPV